MKKRDIYFLFAGFVLMGCVKATFPYKWYYPKLPQYIGTLLGSKPSEDLDFQKCAPDSTGDSGCVVMLKPDYKAMALDYMDLQDQLVACQRSCH